MTLQQAIAPSSLGLETGSAPFPGARRFEDVADAMPQMIWSARADGSTDYCNKRWYDFTGVPHSLALGETWRSLVHPEDRSPVEACWQTSLRKGEDYQIEHRLRHHSGGYRWVIAKASPVRDRSGAIERWFGTYTDIHEATETRAALTESEKRFEALAETSTAMVWRAQPDGRILQGWKWDDFCGQKPEEYEGQGWVDTAHPDDRERLVSAWREAVSSEALDWIAYRARHWSGDYRWVKAKAVPLRACDGSVREWIGTLTDIHEQKHAEEEVWRAANHDSLTGLPNRVLFQRRLEQALAQAKQDGTNVSLLLIDLDDFKDVNDTLGHDAGDALLKEAADRLVSTVCEGDMVARLGGDEFAILVADPFQPGHGTTLAETILERFRQPFSYKGRTLLCRASIGVAASPESHAVPSELMKDADIALYRAKAEGRNRAVNYSLDMRVLSEQRLAIGHEMREAISRDQIVPYYQPKVCLSSGRVIGVEALSRWEHPTRGLITPSTFGSAFDDPDLAKAMGKQLIGKIALDIRKWLNSGLNPGCVAINLSSAEFNQPELADDILRILDLVKVPTKHFEVEVTERVLLEGRSGSVADALEKFRRHGVQIALDDFGTGYASLTHLKQFPVDHIKIDKSFVSGLIENEGDAAIVAAVIGLGKSLNLQVTAEGIETEAQARRLREMGCHNGQGYLYARPLAGADVASMLSDWRRRAA